MKARGQCRQQYNHRHTSEPPPWQQATFHPPSFSRCSPAILSYQYHSLSGPNLGPNRSFTSYNFCCCLLLRIVPWYLIPTRNLPPSINHPIDAGGCRQPQWSFGPAASPTSASVKTDISTSGVELEPPAPSITRTTLVNFNARPMKETEHDSETTGIQ